MIRINSDVMERVVLSLCERIDTPRALSVWLCFKHNPIELLYLSDTDFADNCTEQVQLSYFITEYLSKYKGLNTGINLRGAALERWKSSELQCLETNSRFRNYQLRPFSGRVETVLFRTQRKIAAVLGILRPPVVLSDCKWGPGATFDIRRSEATPDNKISRVLSVTCSALPYILAVIETDPHWAYCILGEFPWGPFCLVSSTVKLVEGSRFQTVPKTSKTDRVIAIEPTGNSFLQQGVRSYMRRRLKRFGVDLDDQSINQRSAQLAYSKQLSTLDLSAASDTISRELVYHLLPLDWAMFLDSLRSPLTLVDGKWIRTEKFVSMGNAFCFELETLIFWALACSVVEDDNHLSGSVDDVTVYGDDIIVPRSSYNSVVKMLEFCGFSVNPDKSHFDGNFFESCGKHYHRGIEITPVYQKELIQSPSEIIRAHNRIVRLVTKVLPSKFGTIASKALRVLTSSWPLRPFPRIPNGVSEDGGFLRPLSEFTLDHNHGFKCHVYDYEPRFTEAREDALYAYKLRNFHKYILRPTPGDWFGSIMSNRPSNVDKQGYAVNATKGSWRSKTRWVPEIALLV